ncbi:MAG: glycosyltransferase family 2 protein, partial [Bacteroidaceae bacterium]
MKLSIVIPIYNAEQYLVHCLDSIYSEDIDESLFEVICVNDGSTDNSWKIMYEYFEKHTNLVLIDQ